MTDRITQLRPNEVKVDLAPQAIIRCKPEDLTRSKQIEFTHAEDDLDEYDAAFLRLDPDISAKQESYLNAFGLYSDVFWSRHASGSGGANEGSLLLMLHKYRREPRGTLTIFLPSPMQVLPNVKATTDRVLSALELDPNVVLWRREDSPAA